MKLSDVKSIHIIVQPSLETIGFQGFFILPIKPSSSDHWALSPPVPQPPFSFLSHEFDISRSLRQVGSHSICPVTGLFHSVQCLPWWLRWWRICLQCRRPRFDPWVMKIPWRRKWQPTLVFLPGKFHGQRSLMGYSPWDCKESATAARPTLWLDDVFSVPVLCRMLELHSFFPFLNRFCLYVQQCWLYSYCSVMNHPV